MPANFCLRTAFALNCSTPGPPRRRINGGHHHHARGSRERTKTGPIHIVNRAGQLIVRFEFETRRGQATRCRLRRRPAAPIARPARPPTPGTAPEPPCGGDPGIVMLVLTSPVLKLQSMIVT